MSDKPKIFPVLLAGGIGTRLWPLSRKSYPKQFAEVLGSTTLFQRSAKRLNGSKLIDFAPLVTITNTDYRFIAAEQLRLIGSGTDHILIEPEVKNTSAAVLVSAIYCQKLDPDAVVLVAPSDHEIEQTHEFHRTIHEGHQQTLNGKIVTFGIEPTRPETGYGYLELSHFDDSFGGYMNVDRFIEKPNAVSAQQMIDSNRYLWNSGIYMFRARDIINTFREYSPKTLELVEESLELAKLDLGFLRLNPTAWKQLDCVSIDYDIMEKAKNLVAVPMRSKWSDLGDWGAIWQKMPKDSDGNVKNIGTSVIDCRNSLLRSEGRNQHLVGLGLDDIVAVAMSDAVLVASKKKLSAVNKIVPLLKAGNVQQAEVHPRDYRPWGWFESLIICDTFQVKRIHVHPGASLSLQSHRYRSEHWIVVSGTATVTIDEIVTNLQTGRSIYVPLGSKHQLENLTEEDLVIIEVQLGTYLGEDDIIRYEDKYAR